jgi:hypothetical protein
MVNENYFRFDRKSFFNFWKTIYGFKNHKSYSEIKLLVLARMFDIRLPKSSNRILKLNSGDDGRKSPNASGPNSGRNWSKSGHGQTLAESGENGRDSATDPIGSVRNGRDPARSVRIWRSPAGIRPNMLAGIRQRRPYVARFLQQLYFCLSNFFMHTKRRKKISRKLFFLKMISSKIFYDGNHFTSKQTEHKK